jgi:hypothetical protein
VLLGVLVVVVVVVVVVFLSWSLSRLTLVLLLSFFGGGKLFLALSREEGLGIGGH